jgi:hypothetical protein
VSTRSPARLPPRIALVGLEPELLDYLRDALPRHWPGVRVITRTPGQPVVADLIVVDQPPVTPPTQPTLWLADIDRSSTLIALGPRFWRTAMPTTSLRLKRIMDACLDAPWG